MSDRVLRILFWITTGIFCAIFLLSAGMYLFRYEMVVGAYESLGFPAWIIYPSAIAKILGVITILSNRSALLREWAYAGFFFDAALAFTAHYMVKDGNGGLAAIALVAVVLSRYLASRTART